ncbi:MAG: hypothetical protein CH6_4255 [Candidatus Kapaibacterium sp.]|jgi:hypothetical protein|nr:MAG: hypothetical protein CH6_4255 [Candidatus Kapabacteria bacterium]ROL58497.1 MAG: hypothetical protein D9V84_01865 [Bacteroidetes/Chlorobi group bacterium Naka2016]
MKKVTFLFLAILLLYACKEEECNPVSNTPNRDYEPNLNTYGDFSIYYYGKCDDEGNFVEEPIRCWIGYKGTMELDGYPCNYAELENLETQERYPFYMIQSNKFVKIYSYSLYPFVKPAVWEEFAPHIWQTLWTRDFSKSTFDTTVLGAYPLPFVKDSLFGIHFSKVWYNFHYKIEDIGDATFNLKLFPKPVQVYGTKVTFYSTATLIDTGLKFPRLDQWFPDEAGKYNYSEFYFNNNRSTYIDKIEMKVYYLNKIGIIWLWVKHKTLTNVKTYQYWFDVNVQVGYGG